MEISKEFFTYLEDKAKNIDVSKMLRVGQSVSDAFPELIEMGKRGEIAYIEWSGKKYYTFMSEDEMYMTMCGKTKKQVLKDKQVEAENFKKEMEQRKEIKKESLIKSYKQK